MSATVSPTVTTTSSVSSPSVTSSASAASSEISTSSSSSSPPPSTSQSPSSNPPPSSSTSQQASPSSPATSAPQTSNTPSTTSDLHPSSLITAPPSTSLTSSTSVLTSNGQLITTVVTFTSVVPGAVITSPGGQHGSSTNVGAIVGGVVGGVVGLALLLLLIILLIRRHRRNREKYLFDGNFDPAHVVSPTAPRISIPEDDNGDDGMGGRLGTGVGGVVTPFQYVPQGEQHPEMRNADVGAGVGAGGYAMSQGQSQRGHGGHQSYTPSMNPSDPGSAYYPNPFTSPMSSSESGNAYMQNGAGAYQNYPNLNLYPATATASAAGTQRAASVSSHGAPSVSNSASGTARSASAIAKEREALGGGPRGGMSLMNPDLASDGAGTSRAALGGNRAAPIVHRDGGRVVEDVHEEEGEEIPPTYDSIPANERR